jgi:RNA polymerase sigma-70 factor (ECF subfamily)
MRCELESVSASETPGRADALAALFRAQRRPLQALAYRLTGSTEDAEDAVQEAFARLAAAGPEAPPEELGRWLARVTTNLGIDALRRRRRRAYAGPWLPAPLELAEADPLERLADAAPDPERRYGLTESATYAFLVALEALSPRQRAALLLRDVLGHSAREAADCLGTTEGSVRVLHLRARRALAPYDEARCLPTPELRSRHAEALARFLACLEAQDARGLEALLAEDVATVTDAAGAYTALAAPLAGRERVARFYLMAALHRKAGGTRQEIRLVNGLPAALVTLLAPVRRQAPRSLLRCELDASGRIRLVHAVLAPEKLRPLFGA